MVQLETVLVALVERKARAARGAGAAPGAAPAAAAAARPPSRRWRWCWWRWWSARRALHVEQARRRTWHPLLLLLRDHLPDEEASMIGNQGDELPSHWCEHEIARHKQKKLKLHTHHSEMCSPDQLELERRRRRRRRSPHTHSQKPRKHRTLLVSAIDEQAKVIHVLDPDELPRRARYTIMVTACLLLFLCLLLVGVTLRMAPLIDDMDKIESQ
ncbi:unnamed protein product [Chilo suppressalis]|uniref:Uncharacterized protein n=1 Tax=Chilo suppressalis TaxID=168631 RepID=A0ABN8BBL8_CHISP|nr:unnamed protein product [Chilo suppressalis]